jgi:hypothetical protein
MRLTRTALLVGLALGLLAPSAGAQRSFEEAVLPLREYRAADARALAEAHAPELRRLYEEIRRCVPELAFHQPGIGFRKPRGKPQLPPHLSIWLIADTSAAPGGGDLGSRAADAFQRYGTRLFQRLLARDPVRADTRLGGYGVVLTWMRTSQGGEPQGETMVVFVDTGTATAFAGGTLGARAALDRADIRLFEGDTERAGVRISVDDTQARGGGEGCP